MFRLLLLTFPILFSLAAATLTPRPSLASSSDDGSADTHFHTAPPTPATPATHSRAIYPDEDPTAARLAWFRERRHEHEGEGSWKFIESPLRHPSEAWVPRKGSVRHESLEKNDVPIERVEEEIMEEKPAFEFRAKNEVPVEKVRGNLMPVSPPVVRQGGRRRGARFNEGTLRRARTSSSLQKGREPPSSPPAPPATKGAEKTTLESLPFTPSSSEAEAESHAAVVGSSRLHSPPTSPSGGGKDKVSQWLKTGSLHPPAAPLGGEEEPMRELPIAGEASQVREVAPYRMWSVSPSLATINLPGFTKLSHRYPTDHSHWHSTLSALNSLDWEHQWQNRLRWAAAHRVEETRSARVSTPFGGVTGGDVATSTPHFIEDPANPAPQLDSITLTGTHKRLNAFRELASLLPPALTGHSQEVFQKHAEAGYKEVDPEFHKAVHPVQYVSQMLRDANGAVVLENAIHDGLHEDLKHTPPEALVELQKERDRRERSRGKSPERGGGGESVEELLGTEHATHNKFWYNFYRNRPAFKIRDPLETPLEEFAAFKPFADAVALKKP